MGACADADALRDEGVWVAVSEVAALEGVEPLAWASRVLREATERALRSVSMYALCDPRCGHVRYVGRAVDPRERLRGHIADRSGLRGEWIAALAAEGLEPDMVVLEEGVPAVVAPAVEQLWIERYSPGLLNVVRAAGSHRVVSFRVEEGLAAWTEECAAALGISRSDLIRLLLVRHLERCEREESGADEE